MGIGALLGAALKKVPWTSLAMTYGPELFQRFKDRVVPREEETGEAEAATERIRLLEARVAEQDERLRVQDTMIAELEETCNALDARVRLFRGIAVIAAAAAAVLLVILIVR